VSSLIYSVLIKHVPAVDNHLRKESDGLLICSDAN